MEVKKCPYCLNEIRPLDTHVAKIIADATDKTQLRITCALERYYHITPVEPKS